MLPDLCVVPEESIMSLNDLSHEQLVEVLDKRKYRIAAPVSLTDADTLSARKREQGVCNYEQEQANNCIAQIGMYISTNGLLRIKSTDRLVKRVRDANLKTLKGLDRKTKDEHIRRAIAWLRRTDSRNRWL